MKILFLPFYFLIVHLGCRLINKQKDWTFWSSLFIARAMILRYKDVIYQTVSITKDKDPTKYKESLLERSNNEKSFSDLLLC